MHFSKLLAAASLLFPAVYGQGVHDHNSVDDHGVHNYHEIHVPEHPDHHKHEHEHHEHYVAAWLRFYETCPSLGLPQDWEDSKPVKLKANECQRVEFHWPPGDFYSIHGHAHDEGEHRCHSISAFSSEDCHGLPESEAILLPSSDLTAGECHALTAGPVSLRLNCHPERGI
ncbi:hypothetical protein VTN00DRAFT_5905 [Thermoascus crustaceus]|uniref:uncharacterized protein n=1 Tax=Thermoascus crustaceus TaxID=5088 RepID=UPI0037432CF3